MKRIEDGLIYLATKFPYGKYKGETFYDIIKKDVGYAQWFVENVYVTLERRTKLMYEFYLSKKENI